MIDLSAMPYWNDDHLAFQAEVRDFIVTQAKPIWLSKSSPRLPLEARQLAGAANLSGIDISREFGGRNLDLISLGIAYEECGRLDVDSRELIGAGHGRVVDKYGSRNLRNNWLPKLVQGQALIGVAVTEPNAGSDIRAIETTAKELPDRFVINGIKGNISRIKEADAFLVFAKTVEDLEGHSLSLFLVPTKHNDSVLIDEHETVGLEGWSYGQLKFDNVEIPKENLIGRKTQGFEIFETHFTYWRVLMSLLCIGAALQTVDEAVEHAEKRQQFGTPIASMWPVIQRFSEATTDLVSARLLCYQALWRGDKGLRFVAEAAMSKWRGVEVAHNVVGSMMIVFGQGGYENKNLIEKRWRDIQGFKIADGTTDVMQSLVGREITGRAYYNARITDDH